ncbi:TIGR04283 family arsenosugar biosynthesis glycosyltransferase [Marisediminicola sp. LYQ134]|uniref:TIGR04283 family arsenosugar biosynthesis glycosyltransferase n=1 Tax=unclassified Marisediminicola TaxID=2618316 RepID=UPI003983C292
MPAASIAIVVPVLDEADVLAERLAALTPLRDRGVVLVVVDGGSSDGTVAVAAPLADLVLTAPRGRAAQMNAGAAAVERETLLFLHADTALPADADARIGAAIARGFRWGRFDVRIDSDRRTLAVVSTAMNWRSHASGIVTGDQALFVQRDLFDRVGGFPDLPLMEDVALSAILRRHSRPARIRDVVVTSARRWEQHGVWRTIVLMWRLRFEYRLGADPETLARRYGYRARDAGSAEDKGEGAARL